MDVIDILMAKMLSGGSGGGGGGGEGGTVTVDSALSATSTNPVQNKVVKAALDQKAEFPSATSSDNGKVLGVADGAWGKTLNPTYFVDQNVPSSGTEFEPVDMSGDIEILDGQKLLQSGSYSSNSVWWSSNKIAVIPGMTYKAYNMPYYYYFFNAQGASGTAIASTPSNTEFEFTVPDGFYYVGFTQNTGTAHSFTLFRLTPTAEEEAALDSPVLKSPNLSISLSNFKENSVSETVVPLKGKKIVNFGDSIFGNFDVPEDVSTFLSLYTGADTYNCGFGGTRMATHGNANYNLFSFYALVDAIVSGDWSAQDAALASSWENPTTFPTRLATLKAIDFSEVDIITVAYGTNDFTGGNAIENAQNLKDTSTYCGAFRYAIEKLLTAYPRIRVYTCTPIFRTQLDENTHEPIQYSDTWELNGRKLPDFCDALRNVSAEYGIKCIDNYYELGFNKLNRLVYYRENDGTHPSVEGRKRIARNVADGITSVGVGWPVGASADLTGYATQAWVGQQGYLTLSDLPVYNGGVT